MPIYEYRCNGCQRRISLFSRGFTGSTTSATCPQCGSQDLHRLFSTFSVRKSYMDTYEDILSDRDLVTGLMHNDPRSLVDWNRRMTRHSDEELTPQYQEVMERMEAGEMPTDLMGGEGAADEVE